MSARTATQAMAVTRLNERTTMTATELQKLITAARAPYRRGIPMDAQVDQDILVGLVDGLGGGQSQEIDPPAMAAGIKIGRELRKLLR